MPKPTITLKAALAIMETAFINERLNTFSIAYAKQDGTKGEKRAVAKVDPESKKHDFKQVVDKVANGGKLKRSVNPNPIKSRIVKLYDLEAKQYFHLSIDLLIKLDQNYIDHENE